MKRLSHVGSDGIAPDQVVSTVSADGQPAGEARLDGATDDVAAEQQQQQQQDADITKVDGVADAAAMAADSKQELQPEGVAATHQHDAVTAAAAASPAPPGPDATGSGPPQPSGEHVAEVVEGEEAVEAGGSSVPPASGAPSTEESR
jgi:hypothetical protein